MAAGPQFGDSTWAERPERVAFNAPPATLSDDITWTHLVRSNGQSNCLPAVPGQFLFRTNNGEAHLSDRSPLWMLHRQFWPGGGPSWRFPPSSIPSEEIYSGVLVPAVLRRSGKGTDVRLELVTEYPFREKAEYRITVSQPVDFALRIRRPPGRKRCR